MGVKRPAPGALPSRPRCDAARPMRTPMPDPRASHPRPLRGSGEARPGTPPTPPPQGGQLRRFPDRQPRRTARGIEWPGFR